MQVEEEEEIPKTCRICFDRPPDSVFMDCGHGGVCFECSLDVWRNTEECYLCRNVSGVFYFFLGNSSDFAN